MLPSFLAYAKRYDSIDLDFLKTLVFCFSSGGMLA
jgi:hypothetical protein